MYGKAWRLSFACALLGLVVLSTGCRGRARLRAMQAKINSLERRLLLGSRPTRVGNFEAELIQGGLRVDIPGDLLFAAGSADLRKGVEKDLLDVARDIRTNYANHRIRVDGHTDSDKPKRIKKKFPTNFHLASARSLSVLTFLIERGGLDEEMFSSGSWAEFNPVASNASRDGKKRNRRVEIFLLRPDALRSGSRFDEPPPLRYRSREREREPERDYGSRSYGTAEEGRYRYGATEERFK